MLCQDYLYLDLTLGTVAYIYQSLQNSRNTERVLPPTLTEIQQQVYFKTTHDFFDRFVDLLWFENTFSLPSPHLSKMHSGRIELHIRVFHTSYAFFFIYQSVSTNQNQCHVLRMHLRDYSKSGLFLRLLSYLLFL